MPQRREGAAWAPRSRPDLVSAVLLTRACRAMIDWAFAETDMIRVEWRADPANAPSIAVARRLGMTHEGVLRQASRLGERQFDVGVWSVLAQEWGLPSSALQGLPSTS